METNQLNSFKSFEKGLSKYRKIKRQRQIVFKAFLSGLKTMKMVDVETGIMRSNITRYVSEWKKQGCIKIIKKGICPITKSTGVQFLTTNPEVINPPIHKSHE